MATVLDDVRVLDVARYVAGPMCTALLADLGADVIRVETPGGADDRTPLPFAEGFHGGIGFTMTNRNKRGLTLDIGSPKGRTVFDKLLLGADIVVTSLPPQALRSLGLDYERLAAIKPDIIVLHLTAFGSAGPYVDRLGFDAIAQVMSGASHMAGHPGEPMKSVAPWVDMSTGFLGAYGLLAALRHRDKTGEGQRVEVNLLQTAVTVTNYFLMEEAFNGYGRNGLGNRAPSGGPADLVRTKDGWIFMVALGNPMFRRWARLIGREEELVADPRFASDESRAAHGEELSAIASEWAMQRTNEEALEQLAQAKIPAGPSLSLRQALDDPHVAEVFIQPVVVEGLSQPVPYVRPPVSFSKTPAAIRSGPPRAGADNDAVLREAGFSAEEIASLRAERVI